MKPRGEKPVGPDAIRAAKLSHVPGVTIAEACKRFGVTKAEIGRARKAEGSQPSLAELAIASLTDNGTRERGAVGDLAGVATWLSYINKDDSTAESVRALLGEFVAQGVLVFEGETWTLVKPWP